MRNFVSLHGRLLTVVAVFVFGMQCWAQGNIRTVLFVKVKAGHDANWRATAKDYVAAVKKAGSDQQFTIWDSGSGPDQHAVVWYSAKWKDIDQENPKLKAAEADLARLFARLDVDTESTETWIDEMQPDMMITSKEIPSFVRTGRTRVVFGKMEEFKTLLREQVVPAVKKAGATSYGVAVARFGTPSNEIHSYIGINGWADFDGPIGAEKGMSASEWKAFQSKLGPLIESTQWDMWKYDPELSYIPAK